MRLLKCYIENQNVTFCKTIYFEKTKSYNQNVTLMLQCNKSKMRLFCAYNSSYCSEDQQRINAERKRGTLCVTPDSLRHSRFFSSGRLFCNH